jgi:hypothetical protein
MDGRGCGRGGEDSRRQSETKHSRGQSVWRRESGGSSGLANRRISLTVIDTAVVKQLQVSVLELVCLLASYCTL